MAIAILFGVTIPISMGFMFLAMHLSQDGSGSAHECGALASFEAPRRI
jgi:hypothetical protein